MTTLKDINFGLNQYCGPAVLSALTGESTDRCAAVISAVSGRQEIKAIAVEHLKEALKRLRFSVEEQGGGSTLFGVLHRLYKTEGLYVVFVPHHVVAVEVKDNQIYICDNHTKTPIDIKQSARLTQRVTQVFKVFPKKPPVFLRAEIGVSKEYRKVVIHSTNIYENPEDNTVGYLGQFSFSDEEMLKEIVNKLIGELKC